MGRGSSKAGKGGGLTAEEKKLASLSNDYFRATRAQNIKAGDKITDRVIDENTGKATRKEWTFHPEGYDTFKGNPYDVTVASVKVGEKTTKVTAYFDRAMNKRNPTASDWGKDLIRVTKTFKNNEIIQKRK